MLISMAACELRSVRDSQIQIDLLEDARELEYHLRLQKMQRNVLAPELARKLFDCATLKWRA